MTSNHLSSSCCDSGGGGGAIMLCVRMLVKFVLVYFTGMLEYKLGMSSEARLQFGSMGMFLRSFSRSWAFFMLKEWGRGANWFTFLVNRRR